MNRNPLLILTNRLPPPNVHTICRNARTFARWLDFSAPILHCVSMSPSRAVDTFAREWSGSSPETKTEIARNILVPRFLIVDVVKRACTLRSPAAEQTLTEIVDANLSALAGLIFVDGFVDADGQYKQAPTLRGIEGVNAFLVLLSRHYSRLRGLWNGLQFVKRICPTILARSDDATIEALVSNLDQACATRLGIALGAALAIPTGGPGGLHP